MAAEHEAISGEKLRSCSVVSSVSSAAQAGAGAGAGAGRGADGPAGLWGAAGAELVGTALLVLLPCLCPADTPPTHAALAAGATVAMLVQCFDHLSFAMFNPSMSLAGALMRKISWRRAALYLVAQLAGALIGAYALLLLKGSESCLRCVTRPALGLSGARAAGVEAVLAAGLALANCAAWDPRTPDNAGAWPLTIGATVAALGLAAGSVTGASMNPARSLGPALLSRQLTHHWVYWVGPLVGAAAACTLYRALWATPLPHPAPSAPARARARPHV